MYHQVTPLARLRRLPLLRVHEEFLQPQVLFPSLRQLQLGTELVGETFLVIRIVEQILARVPDVHVAVGRDTIGVAAVLHEVAVIGHDREMEARLLDVFVERLEITGGYERRDHVRVDVDKVELRRARQRFRHRTLRRIENGNVLDAADADPGLLGELGNHRLHRHEIRRPDHPAHVRLADSFGGRDRLLLHGGGERERRRVRHEISDRKTETALHKRSPRKTRLRHDFLLAYDFYGVYPCRPRAFHRAAWGSRVYGQGDGFRCLRRAASRQTPTVALAGGKAQKTSRTFGVPRGAAVAACRYDQTSVYAP